MSDGYYCNLLIDYSDNNYDNRYETFTTVSLRQPLW